MVNPRRISVTVSGRDVEISVLVKSDAAGSINLGDLKCTWSALNIVFFSTRGVIGSVN